MTNAKKNQLICSLVSRTGTRKILYCMQLFKNAMTNGQDVFICFTNYRKAFNNVPKKYTIDLAEETGINEKDIWIIYEFY